MNKQDYLKTIELYRDSIKEKQEKTYSFLRYIITVASGLIVVLVSLKNGISPNQLTHILFISTIVLLSFGILFGAFVLYEEIILLEKTRRVLLEHVQSIQNDDNYGDLISEINTSWLYQISKIISFSSFILGLISLVEYSIMLDKVF